MLEKVHSDTGIHIFSNKTKILCDNLNDYQSINIVCE